MTNTTMKKIWESLVTKSTLEWQKHEVPKKNMRTVVVYPRSIEHPLGSVMEIFPTEQRSPEKKRLYRMVLSVPDPEAL